MRENIVIKKSWALHKHGLSTITKMVNQIMYICFRTVNWTYKLIEVTPVQSGQ